jgi:hypothetical protein
MRRMLALGAALALTVVLEPTVAAAARPAPAMVSESTVDGLAWSSGPRNPFVGAPGLSAPHSDVRSSNTTPQAGPGAGPLASSQPVGGPCPTILIDRSDHLVAYCLDSAVDQFTFRYSLRLLDPTTMAVLAAFPLPPIGGNAVYPYLDQDDRAVIATGDGHLLRLAHGRDAAGAWHFDVAQDVDLRVGAYCGVQCDYVVSAKPDWLGRVWFNTQFGVVGRVDPGTAAVTSTRLPPGEIVTKALSTAPTGVAVVTDQALYLFNPYLGDQPRLAWRQPYTRGTGVKPGKFVDGSGTAPTFFGPTGSEYVTIVDNAVPRENLMVYRVLSLDRNRTVCSVPLFEAGASAVDNTSIGLGRSVITSNTYGYSHFDYTPVPLPGGITRVDVRRDGSGCDQVWTNPTATLAIPKLSTRSGLVYTFERTVLAGGVPDYRFVAIDGATGRTAGTLSIGNFFIYETLQFNGVPGRNGAYYQSTLTGILRVTPQ